jgi:hypothetical protein
MEEKYISYSYCYCRQNMTCEGLVIGSVAGLALTGAVLSFQVLADKKTARKTPKIKEVRLTADTIAV